MLPVWKHGHTCHREILHHSCVCNTKTHKERAEHTRKKFHSMRRNGIIVVDAIHTCQPKGLNKLNSFGFQRELRKVIDSVHRARESILRVDS